MNFARSNSDYHNHISRSKWISIFTSFSTLRILFIQSFIPSSSRYTICIYIYTIIALNRIPLEVLAALPRCIALRMEQGKVLDGVAKIREIFHCDTFDLESIRLLRRNWGRTKNTCPKIRIEHPASAAWTELSCCLPAWHCVNFLSLAGIVVWHKVKWRSIMTFY